MTGPRRAESAQMADNGDRSDRDQVLDELRGAEKLVVVTHENAIAVSAARHIRIRDGRIEQ